MPRQIAIETAQKIAAVWDSSESLEDAMSKAGLKTKDKRNQNRYRRATEDMLGISLESHNKKNCSYFPRGSARFDRDAEFKAVIFSDAHFWPGEVTPAFKVLIEVLKDIQPDLVVDNGDSLDGASISRFPANSFDEIISKPSLKEEIETCNLRFDEMMEAASKAHFHRNLGNHDMRFEMRLADKASAFEGIKGFRLEDHFKGWEQSTSLVINDNLIVKHRWHGGIHSAYNNVLKAGKTIITGHTHKLECKPWSDYSGTRYGIETGTLSDPNSKAFQYVEDNPLNWSAGFIVLTVDGKRVDVDLVRVIDGKAKLWGKTYG